jgi:hypothetical protein
MAAFPVIRTLATVHLYGHLRAYQRTNSASGTFPVIAENGRQIAGGIQFIRGGNQSLGAERNTQFAALAQLLGNFDSPFYVSHLIMMICDFILNRVG